MSSKIKTLDNQTINQIAAGEVIENPASVVKELVENSLDAQATEILVEIKAGGRQLIRVIDNGFGMSEADALKCLERHATSKIRKAEDLYSISSMGFRGEAIPSIASISKFHLTTCREEGDAYSLLVEGGQLIRCQPAARTTGTTVEVHSLFYNTPARKKFLKSIASDTREIHKLLSTLSLGNPQIKFQLISQGKTMLNVSRWTKDETNEGLGTRISEILGKGFFAALSPLDYEEGPIHICGFIGDPAYNRHNRTGQYTFINGRPVFAPFISSVILEAYGTRISAGRFPVFVLNLSLPGDLVDVNVHPQKREVRLQQQVLLKDLFIRAVHQAFQKQKPHLSQEPSLEDLPWETSSPQPTFLSPSTNNTHSSDLSFKNSTFIEPSPKVPLPPPPPSRQQTLPSPLPWESSLSEVGPSISSIPSQEVELPLTPPSQKTSYEAVTTTRNYVLAKSHNTLNEGDSDIFFIDQRAAHRRILFEALLNNCTQTAESQALLFPVTVELSLNDSQALHEHLTDLKAMGFSIQIFGKNTFMIDALPQLIEASAIEDLLSSLVSHYKEISQENPFEGEKRKTLAAAACKAAIHKNHLLTLEEAQSLIKQLTACQVPLHCPQGKPILVAMTQEEIAKKFQRNAFL